MLETNAMIDAYLEYGMSKQLREKTLVSYEQTLRLFGVWLREEMGICDVEKIRDITIRKYILDLQTRGKYTACADESSKKTNRPDHRIDYGERISNITVNNYLRNMKGFFAWLTEMEFIENNPMRRIKLLPVQRVKREYLEDNEVKALMSVFNKDIYSE